jgi:hypothetical protein
MAGHALRHFPGVEIGQKAVELEQAAEKLSRTGGWAAENGACRREEWPSGG